MIGQEHCDSVKEASMLHSRLLLMEVKIANKATESLFLSAAVFSRHQVFLTVSTRLDVLPCAVTIQRSQGTAVPFSLTFPSLR